MRSLFVRILVWFLGLLVFSVVAFFATSFWLSPRLPGRNDFVRRVVAFETSEAVRTYETGGAPALAQFLDRLQSQFPARHYLLDRAGRDLATGEDRSSLLPSKQRARSWFPPRPPERVFIPYPSEGGPYLFVLDMQGAADPRADLAAFGWIVLVIVLLCYVLAVTLAKPIRALRETVVRFGKGDLDSRARSHRRDEIGDLARAFDQMADRIQTLLTAERRLLQDVSHELRSPLARLEFAVELARNNPAGGEAFSRVKREVNRISALVSELLQVTRAEGDLESRNLEPIQLARFLESLVDDLSLEAESRDCRLRLSAGSDLPWNGDRELLHRAVENVIRNAIRYSPAGCAVDVGLNFDDARIVLTVRDYGPGVPEDLLPHIFRPFFRVEEDRGRAGGGGVGLGLAIAQRAIHLHHGEIKAANVHPGLEVEITLPR